MVGAGIENMKRILVKNPKSLIFAQYVDALRLTGDKQNLDEALQAANKGLLANPDFLAGKLARGRILFEKGDLANAKFDFETVAKQDPFCLAAHKLLIETVEKLSSPFDTNIYANILKTLDPATIAAQPTAIEVAVAQPASTSNAPPPTKAQMALSAALDDIIEEEEKQEMETGTRLLKAVDSIIGSAAPALSSLPDVEQIFDKEPPPAASAAPTPEPTPEPTLEPTPEPAPEPTPEPALEPMPEPALEPMPEPALEPMPEPALEPMPEPAPEPTPEPASEPSPAPQEPNLDDILKEQLADRPVDNLPDLTGTMDSLLSTAVVHEKIEEVPLDSALDAPLAGNHGEINIDSILQEQLADKVETPNLTSDIDALLSTTVQPTNIAEDEVELKPYVPNNAAPNLDDILKEQLADKVETPDLTGDLDALLSSTVQPSEPEPEPVKTDSHPSPSEPNLDDILKEQLANKMETPDLTGDLDALLSTTAQPSEPEPELVKTDSHPFPPEPNLDDILKEQLADKVETPDLTGDLDALLSSTVQPSEPEPELVKTDSHPSPPEPNLDDILKEQLADKVETPDLTGDLDALLTSASSSANKEVDEDEVELKPYVPKNEAPNLDDLIKEQLADKLVGDIPDLTSDMDTLLATETLAEHYMAQKLPQKAVTVYKELLSRDPSNDELKAKLDLAETQIV